MADVKYPNVKLCADVDNEKGLLYVLAEVDGALVPIATQKLGHFEAMQARDKPAKTSSSSKSSDSE